MQTSLCGKQILQMLIIFLFINTVINLSLQHFHTLGVMGQCNGWSLRTVDCRWAVMPCGSDYHGCKRCWMDMNFFGSVRLSTTHALAEALLTDSRQLKLWFALLRFGAQPDVVRMKQGVFVLGSGHIRM